MTVRELRPGEAGSASEVERLCLETAWSERQIADLPEGSVYLVAADSETDTEIRGICSARWVDREAELLNIAVLPDYRRMHVADAMLNRLYEIVREIGCEKIYLEVDCENAQALALYRKHGFAETGKRRGFYRGHDALLMEKTLC